MVQPKDYIKILGVIIDAKIKYKEYITKTVFKGLEVALELKRLKSLSLTTTYQLFIFIVVIKL